MPVQRFVFLLWFACLLIIPVPAQDAGLDEILKKNEEAIGGCDAVKAVQTVQITAKLVIGGGQMEAPITIVIKRPNMVRTETTIQGRSLVSGYDGTTAWMVNPMTGSSTPQKMDEKTASHLANSDVDSMLGSLSALKAGGHTVELLGAEEIEGSATYKLKITRKNGMIATYFLDKETCLPIKTVAKVNQMGQEVEMESFPGNFKKVGGIMVAHTLDNKVGGRSMMQMTYEKIELNGTVDDTIFKMPEAEKPAEKK